MTISDAAQLPALADLAESALTLWGVPGGAQLRLINLSENATYLVEAPGGYRTVLRLHREGYHSRRAIECELAWMTALDSNGGAVSYTHLTLPTILLV